ncbi:hypothetical protein V8D89_000330 [Ganoderma adspersum]
MLKVYQNESTPPPGPANVNALTKAAYNAIWKEGKPFVRNEDGVDVLIDDLGAMAGQSLILVRSEYPQIFQHVQAMPTLSKTCSGLVLTGHPGVGKTMFLFYALGAALATHMPVVFCDRSDSCVLFDDRGVHMVHPVANHPFERRTLFLVDSNSAIYSPPGAFLPPILEGVIVQAVSPDPSRWKQWAKDVRAWTWVLGLWEREEMLALQRTMEASQQPAWANPPPGISYYTPVELFDILGPSARACMGPPVVKSQHGPQADFADYLSLPTLSSDLESVLHMVYSPGTPRGSYEENHLDCIFFLSNAGRPNPNLWPKFDYSVPTLFLCRTLCTALRAHSTVTQRRVAARCAPSPAAAAPLYLPLALDLLVNARVEHTCHIVASDHQTQTQSSTSSSFCIGPDLSFREAPLLLPIPSAAGCDSDAPLDLEPINDNTVLFVPPLLSSASSAPSRAFHALVVSADKTRATLLRMVALSDTPSAHAPLYAWPHREVDLARDRESIRAAIRVFNDLHPEEEEKEEVRWTLAYVALKGGTAERAARNADARGVLGDLRGRVAVGWLELRGGEDKGAKALLNAFEREAEEIREYYERWISLHTKSPRNAVTAGSSAGSVDVRAEERGVFASAAARLKACRRNFLPCLNI